MFPRIREITDGFGTRLRISVEPRPTGALIIVELPEEQGCPRALLDGYGVETLWGFIMAARLALPNPLPDERVDGDYAALFQLRLKPAAALVIVPAARVDAVMIASPLWDRLFAELCLVMAHAREIGRRASSRMH